MSPILDSIGSVKGFGWGAFASVSTAFESIATVTVGATSASSVNFTSIPSTYRHLQIRVYAKADGNDGYDSTTGIAIRFNNDTSSIYNAHFVYGLSYASPGTGWTGANQNYGSIGFMSQYNSGNVLAYTYSPNIIEISDYTNTNIYKVAKGLGADDKNGTGYYRVQESSVLWRSTSAITAITFVPQEFTFKQHSKFALYGMK